MCRNFKVISFRRISKFDGKWISFFPFPKANYLFETFFKKVEFWMFRIISFVGMLLLENNLDLEYTWMERRNVEENEQEKAYWERWLTRGLRFCECRIGAAVRNWAWLLESCEFQEQKAIVNERIICVDCVWVVE